MTTIGVQSVRSGQSAQSVNAGKQFAPNNSSITRISAQGCGR